jgi:arabinogalactan oligomer/maltooligosaccharide transport system permease protein
VLWVLALAFSGQQSVGIVDLPKDPSFLERARGVLPWPAHFSLKNFVDVMTEQPFGRWLLNSVLVSVMTTVLGVFLACTAAYAFSRFRFPGPRQRHACLPGVADVPGHADADPAVHHHRQVAGAGNTFWGLVIVYATTAIPFCVWMLKGYFDTIPIDIEESARIDGASPADDLPAHHPAAGQAGDRHHRAVFVHDGVERIHPRLRVPGGRVHVHGPGGPAVLRRGASPPSGDSSPPVR